jgi:hypothetical protein
VLTLGKFHFLCELFKLDAHERAEMESQAKSHYDYQLEQMRQSGYNEREIKELTRSYILKRAVDEIHEYADYQRHVRKSPERYDHVQSKVARNLKVQKNVVNSRRSRKDRSGHTGPQYADSPSQQNRASEYRWTYEEFANPPKRSKSPKYKSSKYYKQFLEQQQQYTNVTPSFAQQRDMRHSQTSPNLDNRVTPIGKPEMVVVDRKPLSPFRKRSQ